MTMKAKIEQQCESPLRQESLRDNNSVARKPLWWRRQARKKPSKAQRRLLNEPFLQATYLLPRPARFGDCLDWNQVFPESSSSSSQRKIWIELGFGRGDNLLRLAEQYSSYSGEEDNNQMIYFVGSELYAVGTAVVLQRIVDGSRNDSSTTEVWKGYTLWEPGVEEGIRSNTSTSTSHCGPAAESDEGAGDPTTGIRTSPADRQIATFTARVPYGNLRLNTGDGVKLLACLPSHSVEAVLVTFPDPFVQQVECRLLQLDVLVQLWRVLLLRTRTPLEGDSYGDNDDSRAPAGGRLYLATDHVGYHDWSHRQVEAFNLQQQQRQQPTCQNATAAVAATFQSVEPTPDRRQWLPVVSKYERKGWVEGRSTHLSCWEATATTLTDVAARCVQHHFPAKPNGLLAE